MENTVFVALSRQTALRREMDVIANNIANMNTTGFKGEKMMFVEHLVRSKGGEKYFGEKLSYVRDVATVRDTTEGHLKQTGNPLDLAVSGDGYFAVETDAGERYTRNGRFQLDGTGQLVTQEGHPVLSTTGQPFFFGPTDSIITVSGDGTVSTENGALGQIRVVSFADQQRLEQAGSLLLNPDDGNQPEDVEQPMIVQGALESSNVEPIIEMTHMIDVHRSYDSVRSLIEKEDERQRSMIRTMSETS